MKTKPIHYSLFTLIFLLISFSGFSQIENYDYKREIRVDRSNADGWSSTTLPIDIYAKLRSDLSDIRIYNISLDNDTTEVPYLIDHKSQPNTNKIQKHKIINQSSRSGERLYTFHLQSKDLINRIKLNIGNEDFDYKTKLEGSQDLNNWSTIIDDYRILAIKNSQVFYRFTTLAFPESMYEYYKLTIYTDYKVDLIHAQTSQRKKETTTVNTNRTTTETKSINKSESKSSITTLKLEHKAPVNSIAIDIAEPTEYYRPISIQYLRDSFETEKGWKMNYAPLYNGTLSSLEKEEIDIPSVITDQLRIEIKNYDNPPLSIASTKVKGQDYSITANTKKAGTYYLAYGNSKAKAPIYDLKHFQNKIPKLEVSNQLGEEQISPRIKDQKSNALFNSPLWLWAVMLIMIVVLGTSAFRMLKG